MIWVKANIQMIFRLILMGWVALNLVMASVPRCDLVLAAVHKSVTSTDAGMHEHCAPQTKTKGPMLHDHRMCACALAKLVFARESKLQHDPIITRPPQAISVLEFSYAFVISQHISSLETPPPRAV